MNNRSRETFSKNETANRPDPLEGLRVVRVLGEPLGQVHHVLGESQVRHVRRRGTVVARVGARRRCV